MTDDNSKDDFRPRSARIKTIKPNSPIEQHRRMQEILADILPPHRPNGFTFRYKEEESE